MKRFDYIIAGAGGAGLCLASRLLDSGLSSRPMLIVDRDRKQRNDRTWCFWSRDPERLDALVSHRWDAIVVRGRRRSVQIPLAPYRYRMIRGIDFYDATLKRLRRQPTVRLMTGTVEAIEDGEEQAAIVIDGKRYHGDWLFDSLFDPRSLTPDPRWHSLLQHFVGWVVRVDRETFDPTAATLFDFRVEQDDAMQFVYILPFSGREALVEYTIFSASKLPREVYEERLRRYLQRHLHLHEDRYEIVETEEGAIPMTDRPLPRQGGRRIVNLGTKGGRVKPSTGFAFDRMRRDADAIVDSLLREGHPFHGNRPPSRYATFDSMLLNILERRGGSGADLFERLFRRNPIGRLLRFLDEEGDIGENLLLMLGTPWWLFIDAYLRVKSRQR